MLKTLFYHGSVLGHIPFTTYLLQIWLFAVDAKCISPSKSGTACALPSPNTNIISEHNVISVFLRDIVPHYACFPNCNACFLSNVLLALAGSNQLWFVFQQTSFNIILLMMLPNKRTRMFYISVIQRRLNILFVIIDVRSMLQKP